MAGTPPRSPRCMWSWPGSNDCPELADEEADLSDSVLDATSPAGDDAPDAAVDSLIMSAAEAAVVDAAAAVFVRGRLNACGVIGHAATSLMASTIADLRMVAAEVLGDGFTEVQWAVLHRTWTLAVGFPGFGLKCCILYFEHIYLRTYFPNWCDMVITPYPDCKGVARGVSLRHF